MAGGQFTVVRKDVDTVQIFISAPDPDDPEVTYDAEIELNPVDATYLANTILQAASLSWEFKFKDAT